MLKKNTRRRKLFFTITLKYLFEYLVQNIVLI